MNGWLDKGVRPGVAAVTGVFRISKLRAERGGGPGRVLELTVW